MPKKFRNLESTKDHYSIDGLDEDEDEDDDGVEIRRQNFTLLNFFFLN